MITPDVSVAVRELASVVVATVFLVAGLGKLLQGSEAFASTIQQYLAALSLPAHLPRVAGPVRTVAATLPLVQVALALTLQRGFLVREAALAAAALLAMFVALEVAVLVSGQRPACGCFGLIWRERIGPITVLRDAGFLAIAVLVAA